MHKFQVYIPWRIRIALADVEVGKDLVPDTVFHDPEVLMKVTEF